MAISLGMHETVHTESGTISTRGLLPVNLWAARGDILQNSEGEALSLSPPIFLIWWVRKALLPLFFFTWGAGGGEASSGSDSASCPDPALDNHSSWAVC